jgi:chorismate dehydratase
MSPLLIGRIPFLVCAPFFWRFLDSEGPPSPFQFVDGAPHEQNLRLRKGEIHLAPSSSIEYALGGGGEDYFLLSDFCTSSRLEVMSVKLFSQKPWEALGGEPLHLTGQSDTSRALVRVLSSQRFQVSPTFVEEGAFDPAQHTARLLIGDQALAEDLRPDAWPHRYDLAQVWHEWQGLPFVFGAWTVRPEAPREALERYIEATRHSLVAFYQDPKVALTAWNKYFPIAVPRERLLPYYQTLDYAFTPERKRSLELFYQLCVEIGILGTAPKLRFL